jgi:hypothetical protein
MNKQEIEKDLEILKYYESEPYFFSKDMTALHAFRRAISAYEQQLHNGWIPVYEQLPIIPQEKTDEGFNRVAVLVTSKHEDMTVIEWYDPEEGVFYDDWDLLASKDEYVTAWMPLPKQYTTK